MAIVVKNTNYNGEVLEKILTVASTGNEFVDKGLIYVIPGVEKKMSLPRIKSGKMLQKRKENPQIEDSKGNFNYSEKSLDPVDFMAFTVFNPRAFEHIWRKWQPKGNLVFAELPPEAQNVLLEELTKQVKFELGDHYINGEFGNDDDHLMNGILTQAAKDSEVIVVSSDETTMIGKLKAVRRMIPKPMRNNPNLRIIMSVDDFDKYDDELTEREAKNASETDVNSKRYKGITIETLAAWPDDLIVVSLCSPDANGNFFAAVNLQDDEDVIQIDKIANASELYFFKLLMKADTNIAFGEEFVVLDTRKTPVFKSAERTISVDDSTVTIAPEGGTEEVAVTASGEYSISVSPAGFTVKGTDDGISITAEANTTGKAKTGIITLTLDADKSKKVDITVIQSIPEE
ncbi:BACON domain-containing protein [Bacteroides acidifaciens]|uniref:BACON domain-containing protein n=1 Tax=Bacteroides acidifaciens TaxID=85831 RepID=UPI00248B893A|nr:BACON domain-containing protein [Bacteroides acidifaciens]